MNVGWTFAEGFDERVVNQPITGETISVPHSVMEVKNGYFDETITQRVVTYQKVFSYDKAKNHRYVIRFEGVMARATVYLNGQWIGTHIGGYVAFEFEVTDVLEKDNILTLKVDSLETGDHPPFGGQIDYLTYGGVYREVMILEMSMDRITRFLVDADQKRLNARIEIDGETRTRKVDLLITDQEGTQMSLHQESDALSIRFESDHPLLLWTIERPKLYTATLHIDGEAVMSTRFGARSVKVDQNGFYLNGQKVFLRGLNRHQSYPYVGYAMPKSAQEEDAELLKHTLGVTVVRSSHYPPSKHFLNRCDELGLLVFTELPGWQHIGDDAWKAHAMNDLRDMMIEHYNHPSIVIIGTRINESPDDDAFYEATRDLAKSIDTTRPTGGVRYIQKSHVFEDIYTFNDFVHTGDNEGIRKKKDVTSTKHPYLITEHNGHMFPTKSFDNEERRISHAMRHFKVMNDAYKQDGVMGVIGWCMNDYHTHKAFGSNNHICHHGVMDIGRNMKYAASAYASQGESPYLDVLSMMHLGDRASGVIKEVVVATNLDAVELMIGDEMIGIHTRKKDRYKDLPYAPIVIDDLVGNQIETHERFSKKDARKIKNILLETMRNNLKMSVFSKLVLGLMMVKYKMSYPEAVGLYTRYVGGWGAENRTFTFVGLKDGKRVIKVQKGFDDQYALELKTTRPVMTITDTYDVSRVTVEMKNALGERAFYANDVITINVDGNLRLIGDQSIAMQGGVQSFWVRADEPGQGNVTITSAHHATLSVAIQTL